MAGVCTIYEKEDFTKLKMRVPQRIRDIIFSFWSPAKEVREKTRITLSYIDLYYSLYRLPFDEVRFRQLQNLALLFPPELSYGHWNRRWPLLVELRYYHEHGTPGDNVMENIWFLYDLEAEIEQEPTNQLLRLGFVRRRL